MAQGTQEPGDARSTDRSLRASGCFSQLLFVLSCISPSGTLLSSAGRCHRLCTMHTASAGSCCPGHTMHCAIMSCTKLSSVLPVSLTPRNQLWVPDRNKSVFQWSMQVSQMLQGSLREARTDHRVSISVSWFCGRPVISLAFASN